MAGWGFDKGTVWHPVSLPSAAATAAAAIALTGSKKSNGERLENILLEERGRRRVRREE